MSRPGRDRASSSSSSSSTAAAERGAAVYNTWFLGLYDWWVLGFVNSWAWRCPTKTYLLPRFKANVRSRHLDIGVGTGYYLQHAQIPNSVQLTLCDLSPNALHFAKSRCKRPDAGELLCDVRKPLPTSEKYNSISMYFLIHCLPGPVEKKTVVFDHIKHNLTEDGVVSGATVLGKGVQDNFVGRYIRKYCEKDGIMDSRDDDANSFIQALRRNFESVEVDIVGVVLLFKAEKPIL